MWITIRKKHIFEFNNLFMKEKRGENFGFLFLCTYILLTHTSDKSTSTPSESPYYTFILI